MIKKKFNFLITGGTGFIGSNIVRKIYSLGHKIVILDNDSRGKIDNLSDIKNNIRFIKGDIRIAKDVIEATKEIDYIIHLAYINGTKNFYEYPYEVLEVAVKGMINILDAMDINNIDKLILASSSEVYQMPSYIPTDEKIELSVPDVFNARNSYGGGKIISELLSINYSRSRNKNLLIFRPHNVYGPNMGNEHVIPDFHKLIYSQINNSEINLEIQGSGKETRSFIYIDDFIQGFQFVLDKGLSNNIYNIGTEYEISINDLIQLISKIINKKINIINKPITSGSTLRRCPDINKIKKLGFYPKITLEEGIKKTFDWYTKNRNF